MSIIYRDTKINTKYDISLKYSAEMFVWRIIQHKETSKPIFMNRLPHQRLRDLRLQRGFRTQKTFCAHLKKCGGTIALRRYGSIERGDIRPQMDEILEICAALKISSDAWLFGVAGRIDVRALTVDEVILVEQLVEGLARIRR